MAEVGSLRRQLTALTAAHAREQAAWAKQRAKTLPKDQQRLYDLVRQQRSELLEAELITLEEYAVLADTNADAPRRLESYDEVRARAEQAEAALAVALDFVQHKADCPARFCVYCNTPGACKVLVSSHEFTPMACTCGAAAVLSQKGPST